MRSSHPSGALINASWEMPVGGSGYNLTDRKLQIAEVRQACAVQGAHAAIFEMRPPATCQMRPPAK